jgi:agmatine deiminase
MSNLTRRLPAEWEKHQATLLAFPHDGKDWPGKYDAVKWAFVEIIRKVAPHETVLLVVKSREQRDRVAAMLKQAHADVDHVRYIILNTNIEVPFKITQKKNQCCNT